MKKERFYLLVLLGAVLLLTLTACGAPPAGETATGDVPTSAAVDAEEPAAKPTATLDLPPATQAATLVPRISEQRRITLEFPPSIRTGDSDNVRLTLEVDEFGNLTPTAIVDGNVVTGETVEIPNLYDTHYVIAEARFDMAGVQVIPPDRVSEPLLPGEKATFFWSVRPEETGQYRGTVWLYLRFTPKAGGDSLTRTISAQFVEINATTFMGLKAGPARWLGAIGTFLSGLLGMPFFEEVVKWLWGRLKA
jgi:hypothetical protein